MIESKETGNVFPDSLSNTRGFYVFNNPKDKYKEALKVFFYNGVNYKNKILLSSLSTPTLEIKDFKTVFSDETQLFEIIFSATDYAQKTGTLKYGAFFGTGDEVVWLEIDFVLDFDNTGSLNITNNAPYLVVDSSELIGDRSFKIVFHLLQEIETESYFLLDNSPGYLWRIEQNIIQPNGTFFSNPPVMDASDYVSFLWSVVNTGKIINQKIFSCDSLLNNRFEKIKFIEKIISNNTFIKYGNYKDLLKELKEGDILIFKDAWNTHCLLIIDPVKEDYSECSGFVEYNNGAYYNGKLSPIPFELRFNSLKQNTDVYLCRLYN